MRRPRRWTSAEGIEKMAIEQPTTLQVVAAGEVVDAEWVPSGVPGLALVGRPITTGWRLVHMASGRAVSRSAEHENPEAVRDLARRIAPLADWTEPNVAVAVPRLRQELERVIAQWQAARGVVNPTRIPSIETAGRATEPGGARGSDTEAAISRTSSQAQPTVLEGAASTALGRDLPGELEKLASRLRAVEHERTLLREVVRRLHAVLDKGLFADALSDLSQSDREFVRALVDEESAKDATAVVQAIRRGADVPGQRTPAAGARPPVRPRTPRFSGPDAAAS